MNNQIEIIRCNHCSRSHRSDYCIKTGKVPSIDCIEDDIQPSDFAHDLPQKLYPKNRLT